jgi:7-cyano-7-deazaguanine synthase
MDSAVTLAIARNEGFRCHALTIDYGQRHRWELHAAERVAGALGAVEHKIFALNLRAFGGSALTAPIDVPKDRPDEETIPVTYVPARNTIFLALALAWAETIAGDDLFIGVNAIDYSGYPDCRPDFIAAFEQAARLATRRGIEGRPVRVHAPLLHLTKGDIVRAGLDLGVDLSLTHSCYDPEPATGRACGRCDACRLREAGFRAAGLSDPTGGSVLTSEPQTS